MALVILPHRPPLSSIPGSLLCKPARSRFFLRYPHRPRSRVPNHSIGRLAYVPSRCSFTNVDIDLEHVATGENVSEHLLPIASGCSIPVVHLKANILDSNFPSLPIEDTSAEYVCKELDYSSEVGGDTTVATPTHPASLYALYASFLLGNLVEQLWNITWPAAVATLHPTLLPVAIVGFFAKLTIFIAGPMVGKLMDHFPRLPAYHSLNFVQTAAQLLSAWTIIYALNSVKCDSTSHLLLQPWFILLVVAGAVERLAGLALGVAMERDWVVLLAGKSRPLALSCANSMLSRIDLSCEIAGASLFGMMLSKYNLRTCLKLASCLMICMLPVLVILGEVINRFSNGMLDCSKSSDNSSAKETPFSDARQIVRNGLDAIEHGWNEYKHQPVLPASLAYVLLYFNVALAPGAIMTALLTHHGIHPSIIGAFSGLCSVMGFAATFISSLLVKQFGLLKAGASGLIFQAFLLSTAVVVYWTSSVTQQVSLVVFLSLIVLSRLGHMSYDVVGTQILQTGIPITKANLIGTTEVSVASLAEFLMLGVAIIANDVSHFGFLAALSLSSVVGAAAMFCKWLANPSDEHRKLFKFDLHYN